ncbi:MULTISPECIES: hypothetical protein [Brachyspira]|uniref:hypothetical protein n=1 Tax=Brachyspira TaxID=29521 RepID=UPI0026EAC7F7|nr:hypothetical protein [Brachyspira innocens]
MPNKKTSIKELDDYIKAHKDNEKAKAVLDEKKKAAIRYLKNNTDGKIEYNHKNITLVNTNKYSYSSEVTGIQKNIDALIEDRKKQEKIEVLNGTAKVIDVSSYIKMTDKEA